MGEPATSEEGNRVVVLGGGITGLATAYALSKRRTVGGRPFAVTVLEATGRVGGNIRTTRLGAFLIDDGADSWVAAKPEATALARDLGLGADLIETRPENRRVYVVSPSGFERGAGEKGSPLVALPDGLTLGIPTRMLPLLRSPLLSWRGKLRTAVDLVAPSGFGRRPGGDSGDADESVADFIRRRLGGEALDALVAPLLGGLFTGDVSRLSLLGTFPQLAALEARGGLIRGARELARRTPGGLGGPRSSAFTSLRGGVGVLISALEERVGEHVRRGCAARQVRRLPPGDARGRFSIEFETGAGAETMTADHVVVAGPAHVAASLVASLDAPLAAELSAIPYGSAATVFLAFREGEIGRPLDANGYLVPASARRRALASTWISSKWDGRAPEGHALLRVFFGGGDVDRDDGALVALAQEELRYTIGVAAEPTLTHVARFVRASPQPLVGHPARLARIRERLATLPGLHLGGSAYEGVGIADCVRQAERIADAIANAPR